MEMILTVICNILFIAEVFEFEFLFDKSDKSV